MELREATPADNESLIELTRETPMIGAVTAYVDRAPDFFALTRLQGDRQRLWIAEENKEPLGCICGVSRWVRYRGDKVRQLYGCDLKVHPRARSRKLGKVLSRQYLRHALENDEYDMAEAEIIAGNDRSLNIVSWASKELCPAVHAGMAHIYQVMPYRRYRVDPAFDIRTASLEDVPAISKLLHTTYKDYASSPLFDEGHLERALNQGHGFGIDCLRVAEHKGRIVAAAAFWDQFEMRRTVVQKTSSSTAALLAGLRAVKPLMGLPPLPKKGHPLRHVFLRFPAAKRDHLDALRSLVHAELNAMKKKGLHQFLWASFHQADPLAQSIEKTWKTKMSTNVFQFSTSDTLALSQEASRQPSYVDFALI